MCKEKNRTIVEYALKDATKPINVASYHVVSKLPKELNYLNSLSRHRIFIYNLFTIF